ncbi:MAG: hypothetical protein J0H49_02660 [Acidobacteria bacterium]|nr:hypothetical protein [Acidobacteriota bacterium]
MDRISQLLRDTRVLSGTSLKISYTNGQATISFPSGRSQVIYIREANGRYQLTSRVVGSARVGNIGLAAVARMIWARNRSTDVVEFAIDELGRLVGRIEHVTESLDRAELEAYLIALAQECDRFEYVLTGRDQM